MSNPYLPGVVPAVAQRPLDIAIVTETYPPEVNGVANTVARYVHGLAARGHRVQVVRPRQGGLDGAGHCGAASTLLVSGLPLPGYRGLRLGLPAGRRLNDAWQVRRPDVLYVATEGLLGWSAVRIAERLTIPCASGFHTNFHSYTRHYGVGLLRGPIYGYLRALHNRTACTVVPTEQLRTELARGAFSNLAVLGRGIDASLFDPARRNPVLRRAWGAGPDDLVVLYVGRLAAEKNLPLAVRAADAMRRADPRVRFVVVGDGPLHAALFARHPNIVFCGMKTGEPLAEHYASADVFLFPSETETFGNVTLEAMASGLAVVAYDYAGARALIAHGQNGLLAPLGGEEAFVGAALRLVGDPAAMRRLGGAARQSAIEQDWSRVLDRFERLLMRIGNGDNGDDTDG